MNRRELVRLGWRESSLAYLEKHLQGLKDPQAYQDRLSEATQPGLYILQRVHDTYELLKFLDQIHLQIGNTIAFQRYDDYTGLYHLVIHGQEISINQVIAQQLYIEKHAV